MKTRAKAKAGPDKRLLNEISGLRKRIAELEALNREYLLSRKDSLSNRVLYESILDGITSGVWVADENDVIYYVNKAMEMIAGVTHQKLIGFRATDFPENTINYFIQHYQEAKDTLQPVYYSEVSIITPAGRQTYQSGWLIPIINGGKFSGMICTVEDITNQKQTRKALKESEAKYRELVENANSIIMRLDLNGAIIFLNRFAQKFFGFSEDEIIGRNVLGTIIPETETYAHNVELMLRDIGRHPGRYSNTEHAHICKDGEQVWIAWTNKALFDENGHMTEILCLGYDITVRRQSVEELKKCRIHLEKQVKVRTAQLTKTNEELQHEIIERKWVEQVLRSSEEKYRLVVENASEGIIVNQDGIFKYANPKAVKILGHSEEALTSKPFIDFIHPDDKDMVMERHLKRLKGDYLPSVYSCKIIDKDGNTKWIEINSVLITWMGRPATLAFFSNITERKRAEERLRLLKSAIQQANDSIVITTAGLNPPGSKVVFINPAFTRMTGYTAEEVINNPSIIQQGTIIDRSELFKSENSQMQSEAFYIETINNHKNGVQFNLEWQIAPVRDEHGKVTHFISIQRDITERRRTEEKIKANQEQLHSLASELSLAEERERRRIATELHDHIGQTLAITKIKLGALRDSIDAVGYRYSESLDDVRALIEKTIRYTKTLTFELSPPTLYELGFEATIEWLGEQIQTQHNIFFEFKDDGKLKPLDRDVSVLLFQAVRELFMNIVKHAQAHKMTATLQREGYKMLITIEDDGIGFDSEGIDKTRTFGFFSIRERLKHFGGAFEIDAGPGRGTRVVLTAPVALKGLGEEQQ